MKGLTPIILILVSVGIFFFFIEPEREKLDLLNAEKEKNQIAMDNAEKLRAARGALTEKYNNISVDERERLLKILPDTVDNVRLILDVNNIAAKHGLVLRGINISGGPLAEGGEVNRGSNTNSASRLYGDIQFSFTFSASYDEFKIFLKDLEDSLRLVDVTDLSVTSSETDIYNYSISFSTYWLR